MSEILGTAYSGWATEQSFFDSRRGKEISLYSQTADNGGSGARPASHSFGIWATSPWMQRPAVKIPTYLGLVPKLCMTAAVVPPPPSRMLSWVANGQLCLYFTTRMQLQNVTATLPACSYTVM